MQQLKSLIKQIASDSIFTRILKAKDINEKDFNEAVQTFSAIEKTQDKQKIIEQTLSTFNKPHSTRQVMCALLLLDYLCSLQPQISLIHTCYQPRLSRQGYRKKLIKNQKLFTSEQQVINFYFNYLRNCAEKTKDQIDFNHCQLEKYLEYCQKSMKKIFQFLKLDQLWHFLIKNSSNQTLLKLILQSILQKLAFDVRIINKFLEKNLKLVTSQHLHCFRINQLYENMLSFGGKIAKLKFLAEHLQRKIIFQSFKVDSSMNKTIQIEMWNRKEEKINYLKSTRLTEQTYEKIEKQQGLQIQGDTMVRLNDFI